jgi:hypothetical protein
MHRITRETTLIETPKGYLLAEYGVTYKTLAAAKAALAKTDRRIVKSLAPHVRGQVVVIRTLTIQPL